MRSPRSSRSSSVPSESGPRPAPTACIGSPSGARSAGAKRRRPTASARFVDLGAPDRWSRSTGSTSASSTRRRSASPSSTTTSGSSAASSTGPARTAARVLGVGRGRGWSSSRGAAFDMWNTRYFILPVYPELGRRATAGSPPSSSRTERIVSAPRCLRGARGQDREIAWAKTHDYQIRRNLNAYPRGWVVHDARSVPSFRGLGRAERDLPMQEILFSNDLSWPDPARIAYDPRRYVWLEDPVRPGTGRLPLRRLSLDRRDGSRRRGRARPRRARRGAGTPRHRRAGRRLLPRLDAHDRRPGRSDLPRQPDDAWRGGRHREPSPRLHLPPRVVSDRAGCFRHRACGARRAGALVGVPGEIGPGRLSSATSRSIAMPLGAGIDLASDRVKDVEEIPRHERDAERPPVRATRRPPSAAAVFAAVRPGPDRSSSAARLDSSPPWWPRGGPGETHSTRGKRTGLCRDSGIGSPRRTLRASEITKTRDQGRAARVLNTSGWIQAVAAVDSTHKGRTARQAVRGRPGSAPEPAPTSSRRGRSRRVRRGAQREDPDQGRVPIKDAGLRTRPKIREQREQK